MIELKTPAEIRRMHVAGRFVAEVLSEVGRLADVGVNLLELEHHVRGMIKRRGAESCYWDYAPSFGRGPFRNVICLSVNDAVLHGLPHDYTLRDGDVLSADTIPEVLRRAFLLARVPPGGPTFVTFSKDLWEQRVKRAARGAEREELLAQLDELGAWYRDLVAVAVGADRAAINLDKLAELREDATRERLAGAERAAEAVRASWRGLEELNLAPQLALEALFVRIGNELAP